MRSDIIVGFVVAILAGAGAANADETFKAFLSGDQENPPVDTGSWGTVKIKINDSVTAGEFTLTVNDGVKVQQAHIHCGVPGMNGPVVVWLAGMRAEGWDVDGVWVGNATFTDGNIVDTTCGSTVAELVQSIKKGRTYANVHTVAHPGGEIRGLILLQ